MLPSRINLDLKSKTLKACLNLLHSIYIILYYLNPLLHNLLFYIYNTMDSLELWNSGERKTVEGERDSGAE
jgi:hypothetical protein